MFPKPYLLAALILLAAAFFPGARAQSDAGGMSLGDLARSLRKQKAAPAQPAKTVIDNDNLSNVMDQVESDRQKRKGTLNFTFDEAGKEFKVASPDVTCSLSFNAQATALLSDPYAPQDLPDSELAKLDGPAIINGDDLEISVYNGSGWNLKEITVGLTIIRPEKNTGANHEEARRDEIKTAYFGAARLVPVSAQSPAAPATATAAAPEKHSDVTVLYHLKGFAAPLATTVFRETLPTAPAPDQEWHWAIVQARGVPPAPPSPQPEPPQQ
jgi:hypothetical protein